MIRRIVFAVLLLIIGVQQVSAVAQPGISPVQEPPSEPLTGFYTPNTLLCSPLDGATSNSTQPIPACPSGNVEDTYPFIIPCQDKGRDDSDCTFGAYVYGQGFAHVGSVSNKVYNSQGFAVQESNDKSLLYRDAGNRIEFIQDTTWANAETCNGGPPVFQRISNGGGGMLWAPREISCVTGNPNANTYMTPGTNSAYIYNSADELTLRTFPQTGINSCPNHIHAGNVDGQKQLIFNGPARCGAFQGNMLVLYNKSGAGAGEVFMYCENKGLCAWYQKIDFSKSGAQPGTWTASTDLCNGFQAEYNVCKVACAEDGINQVVRLSFSEALVNLINVNVFGRTLYSIKQVGDHSQSIEDKAFRTKLSRILLPGEIDYKPAGPNCEDPANPGKVLLNGNCETNSITFRSMLQTGQEAVDQNNAPTVVGSQTLTTDEELDNTQHAKEYIPPDDDNYIGSAVTGIARMSKNKDQGISLTKPNNVLEENIWVPCNGTQTAKTASTRAGPQGENRFTSSGNPVQDIAIQVTSSIVGLIGRLLEGLVDGETLGDQLAVPMELCSCTYISNHEGVKENTKQATYPMLPAEIIKTKIEPQVDSGSVVDTNTFTNPLNQDETINIDMAYSGTHKALYSMACEEAASMPREVQFKLGYANKCGNKLTSTTPGSPGNPGNPGDPIDCSVASFQSAFGSQATIAACVAQNESSCNAAATNKRCLNTTGFTWDYSIGLFQINLLAHPAFSYLTPPDLFQNPDGSWKPGIPPGTWTCKQGFSTIGGGGAVCRVGNQAIVDACEQYFLNPQNNMAYAAALQKSQGWRGPWLADAAACGF